MLRIKEFNNFCIRRCLYYQAFVDVRFFAWLDRRLCLRDNAESYHTGEDKTDQYDKRCRSIRSANGSGDKTKKEDTGDERNRKWYGIYCFDVNAGGEGNN
jgi:hypothetical protein